MNVDELERSLGVTFHDAGLERLSFNFVNRTIELTLDVFVGDPDSPDESERERQRKARLVLKGFTYSTLEPPDPRYPYAVHDTLSLDPCDPLPELAGRYPSPAGSFSGRFFIVDWNAFLHYQATDAELVWLDNPQG